MTVTVTSFGYGHAAAPQAHITLDVRDLFRDPHLNPAMVELTGRDQMVIDSVLRQSGALELVADVAQLVLRQHRRGVALIVAFGCQGGRHRSPALADELARYLARLGVVLVVTHRDIDKPILARRVDPEDGRR